MRAAPLLLAFALVAGCDGDGLVDAPPGNFAEVSVEALAHAAPGRYSTTAYVAAVVDCPSGSLCLVPGSATLASSPDPAPRSPVVTLLLDDAGRLFEVGERYVFSVRVERAAPPPRVVTLLGYARAGRGA